MLGIFGGVYYLEQKVASLGDSIPGHAHQFDHVSVLLFGKVRVNWYYPDVLWKELERRGKTVRRTRSGSLEFQAPAAIPVFAGVMHDFVALSEGGFRLWCVHASRGTEGQVIGASELLHYLGDEEVVEKVWLEILKENGSV
jgi:hypothetical protein